MADVYELELVNGDRVVLAADELRELATADSWIPCPTTDANGRVLGMGAINPEHVIRIRYVRRVREGELG